MSCHSCRPLHAISQSQGSNTRTVVSESESSRGTQSGKEKKIHLIRMCISDALEKPLLTKRDVDEPSVLLRLENCTRNICNRMSIKEKQKQDCRSCWIIGEPH